MNKIVSLRNVSKRYGNFEALQSVSFDVEPGSIVGLIGPNGAGKTTTLKAILGLCNFSGDMEVLGIDPRKGRHEIMQRVCFISDVGVLPRWMKVNQVLEYVAGVHPKFDRAKAIELLSETNIPSNKKVGELSKGMVTQLHLSIVMAIDVELLVLDEPTIGLDILYRKTFYDRLLNDYFDHQRSIIVSTHQVEEIESILSHLVFIDSGRIALDRAMDSLAEHYVELLVGPDRVTTAQEMGPIYTRDVLGKKSMIFEFESVPREKLEALGEIGVPAVADLFVAKMSGGRA